MVGLDWGYSLTEERDFVIPGTLVVDTNPTLVPNSRFAFGTRTYPGLLGIENNDAPGIAVGMQAAYALPGEKFSEKLTWTGTANRGN